MPKPVFKSCGRCDLSQLCLHLHCFGPCLEVEAILFWARFRRQAARSYYLSKSEPAGPESPSSLLIQNKNSCGPKLYSTATNHKINKAPTDLLGHGSGYLFLKKARAKLEQHMNHRVLSGAGLRFQFATPPKNFTFSPGTRATHQNLQSPTSSPVSVSFHSWLP